MTGRTFSRRETVSSGDDGVVAGHLVNLVGRSHERQTERSRVSRAGHRQTFVAALGDIDMPTDFPGWCLYAPHLDLDVIAVRVVGAVDDTLGAAEVAVRVGHGLGVPIGNLRSPGRKRHRGKGFGGWAGSGGIHG